MDQLNTFVKFILYFGWQGISYTAAGLAARVYGEAMSSIAIVFNLSILFNL